jgi:hypothetical protein
MLRDTLLLSRLHYEASCTSGLLKARERRKILLAEIFGTPDSRLLHGKFAPGSRAFIASMAPSLGAFWKEYDHFIAEDAGDWTIRIGAFHEPIRATKTGELAPSTTLSFDSPPSRFWRTLRDIR